MKNELNLFGELENHIFLAGIVWGYLYNSN